ncbi:RNA-binding 5, partial [Brachionus plicatilis]
MIQIKVKKKTIFLFIYIILFIYTIPTDLTIYELIEKKIWSNSQPYLPHILSNKDPKNIIAILKQILNLDTQSKLSYNQVHSPIESSSAMTYGPKKGNQTDAANSAAAVAQAAMISMHKKQEMLNHLASQDIDPALGANLEYIAAQVEKSVTPDVSQFAFDETSGFYYDYSTGLYYDPNSHYYYNATTQQYLYYDTNTGTYLPVTGSESAKAEESKAKSDKVKNSSSKPKTAAQIAK